MFVRSGYFVPGNRLLNAGLCGNHWSSVSLNNYFAYYLNFYPNGVDLSSYFSRYFGQSVRCVALGG